MVDIDCLVPAARLPAAADKERWAELWPALAIGDYAQCAEKGSGWIETACLLMPALSPDLDAAGAPMVCSSRAACRQSRQWRPPLRLATATAEEASAAAAKAEEDEPGMVEAMRALRPRIAKAAATECDWRDGRGIT
eukprot:gnl/TRDRNA2_/TRDRNA2_82115_c0_seq2.p2 gnl/TRDRNA2_/TRDRNA2_82115_c0~~gnl/TRDRNA2_/TRDRNA2_82115_c0_seq2.p2  ORF type:complete len:137 (+),score=29.74 gnl/TRDRNA2_/TRDRNA2_82115_c0_seq2:88-498(+)